MGDGFFVGAHPCGRWVFCWSPPLWVMGVEHALQAIAHRVGSYKDNNSRMANTHMGHSNFIKPDP